VKVLREAGYDICQMQYNGTSVAMRGWYMKERKFKDWEIKVLIDAVQQAQFLSKKISGELIEKLLAETNDEGRTLIEKDIQDYSFYKTENSDLDTNIEAILRALRDKKQISFKYQDISADGTPVLRKYENGALHIYEVNPYSTVWLDQFYYLICNTPPYSNFSHYRLDRMIDVQVIDIPRMAPEKAVDNYTDASILNYVRKSISQFSGETLPLELKYFGDNINPLTDLFGRENVHKVPGEDKYNIMTSYSDGLFYTLLSIGEHIEILSPRKIRLEYLERLENIRKRYE